MTSTVADPLRSGAGRLIDALVEYVIVALSPSPMSLTLTFVVIPGASVSTVVLRMSFISGHFHTVLRFARHALPAAFPNRRLLFPTRYGGIVEPASSHGAYNHGRCMEGPDSPPPVGAGAHPVDAPCRGTNPSGDRRSDRSTRFSACRTSSA